MRWKAANADLLQLRPDMFGASGDTPVARLVTRRYRALMNRVAAPGLSALSYFHRYTEDAIGLCDILSSFNAQGKAMV